MTIKKRMPRTLTIALALAAGFIFLVGHQATAQAIDQAAIAQALAAQGAGGGTAPTTAPAQPNVNALAASATAAAVAAPAAPAAAPIDANRSPLESMFAGMAASLGTPAQELSQFGYSLFEKPTAPSLASIGDDYILGPGDSLVLYLWGDPVDIKEISASYTLPVDRNGNIFLPPAGQIAVWGQDLTTVRSVIKSALDRRYKKLEMSLTLATLRQFPVFVSGYAGSPGTVLATGADTLLTVLSRAGGIKKTGSLRGIVLTRQGKAGAEKIEIDLYDSLIKGLPVDLRIREGDALFVPGIGSVAALAGELKRPGIYELKGDTSITTALGLAGGALPSARSGGVTLLRFSELGKSLVSGDLANASFSSKLASDGDFVYFGKVTELLVGQVQVTGPVKYSGRYEIASYKSLKALLSKAQLVPETNLFYGRVYRMDLSGRDRSFAFSPRDVLAGGDITLAEFDRVVLYRYDDVGLDPDFDRFKDTVLVSGPVKYPGFYLYKEGATLAGLLADNALSLDASRYYAEITATKADGKNEYFTFSPDEILSGKGDIRLSPLDRIRFVKKGAETADHDFNRFPEAVLLAGQVARSEVFALRPGLKLSQVLGADQILLDTNLNYAEIVRARGDGKNEYLTFRPSDVLGKTFDLDLGPRDLIRLVKVGYALARPDFDRFKDAVQVSGPVEFSGLYAWREGMKLSQLLLLAKPALDTNQVYAEVVRPLGGTKFEYLTFAPREIAAGISDVELKARDQVRLYTTAPAAVTAPVGVAAMPVGPANPVILSDSAQSTLAAPGAAGAAQGATKAVAQAAGNAPVDPASPGILSASPQATPTAQATAPQIPTDYEKQFYEIVTVSGTVRYAGPYARTASLKLSSVVTKDQLLEETSLEYAELTRLKADGTQEYFTFAPREVLEGKFDLPLRAKDSIRLVRKTPFGGVLTAANVEQFADIVQLTGQVARPEVFALRPGLKLSQVLGADQILLDTNLNYAEILRVRTDGKNEYLTFRPGDVLGKSFDLDLGSRDLIRLVKVGYAPARPDFDRFKDAVQVSGPVEFSGLYAWREGMKISQLLALAKPALDTNQVYAEVVRPLGGTKFEYLTFAPREIAAGISDVELKARDQVRLYTTAPVGVPVGPESPVILSNSAQSTPVDAEKHFFEIVTVSGTVRYVGPYARTASLKLSSVVTKDQVLEETNLEYAELTRLKVDGTQEYLTFAPKAVLDGSLDLALRARDAIRLVPKTEFKAAKAIADLDKFADAVQLTGQVARPEIFAYRDGLELSQVLGSDQILLDTNLNYAEILRVRADGKNEYLTFNPGEVLNKTLDLDLGPRDLIRLVKVGYAPEKPDFDRFKDAVQMTGPVEFSGLYAWREGMKLSSLLALAKPALETNQVYGEIVRPLGGTKFEYQTFAPREIASGTFDLVLRARDSVKLYTTAPAAATKQGAAEGEATAEGAEPAAAASPGSPVNPAGPASPVILSASPQAAPVVPVSPASPVILSASPKAAPAETAAPSVTQSGEITAPVGKTTTASETAGGFDLSRFLEVVTISGAVRYSGPYARTPSLTLASVITPDQMLEETNLDYGELVRLKEDGSSEYHTFAPRLVLEGNYDLPLRARDSIRLVKKTVFGAEGTPSDFEKFADVVQLIGQVARPEVFAFQPGMKLSQVLTKEQILLGTNLNYGEIVRFRTNGRNEYYTFRPSELLSGDWDFALSPRDLVRMHKVNYSPEKPDFDRFGDAVMVSGSVRFVGLQAWRPGMKLSVLQKSIQALIETNQVYADILRLMPDGATQIITFAPREVASGLFDTEISARDRVRYFSTAEIIPATPVVDLRTSGTATPVAVPTVAESAAASPGSLGAPAIPANPASPVQSSAATPGISTDKGFYLEVVNTQGAVRYVGPYARTPTLKLSSVVTPDQILQETNLDYAELTRRKADGGWEYQSFSPREVLAGRFDLALRAQDSITYLKVGYLPEKPDFDHFGNAYALTGRARLLGLYSLDKPRLLSDIITAEQLLSDTDIHYAEIERWVTGGRTEYLTFSPLAVLTGSMDMRIFPRDIIRLVLAGNNGEVHDFSSYSDTVLLKGTVRYPGRYAWYEGLSLSGLLAETDLLIETDSGYAEISRRSSDAESIISFSPLEIVQGRKEVVLQPRDTVILYPKYFNHPVTISGEVAEPRVVPYFEGIELSSLLRSVKLSADIASLKAVITKTSGESSDVYLDDYLRRQANAKIILQPGDAVTIKKLLPDENLPIVTVRGAIRQPQAIEFKEGMRLAEALEAAGGYSARAYPKGLVLIRKNAAEMQQKQVDRLIAQFEAASAMSGALPSASDSLSSTAASTIANLQIDLAMQKSKLGGLKQLYKEGFGRISIEMPESLATLSLSDSNVILDRDDLIFVPTIPTYVLVSGEVADQTIIAYRSGMTVNDAISQSGWLSREADLPRVYIMRASGRLEGAKGRGFLWFKPNVLKYKLNPGDLVVVPSKTVKIDVAWAYVRDSFTLIGTILTSALTAKTLLGL